MLKPENKNMRKKPNFIKKVVLKGNIYFLFSALPWSSLYHSSIEEHKNNTENRTEVKTHFVKSQSMVSLWT